MADDHRPYENITRVFWIKIELEDDSRKGKQFRGKIKDVINDEESRVKSLLDIHRFVALRLRQTGIKIHWYWLLPIWATPKRNNNSLRIMENDKGENNADI